MAIKPRFVGFVVLCWAAAPLLLNLVVVGTLLGVPCSHFVPANHLCSVDEIQCGILNGYNEGKECTERKQRKNTETDLFSCKEDLESYTDCVVDPDHMADCYKQWDCKVKGPSICGYDVDKWYYQQVNLMKTDPC